ncbi:hypothetical protein BDN72DRAFT_906362 [Pluteus cervinus]|uniref:Uncharacterized protein n=1 Tax=Pluteus cervinus TaxID=181527 RepID=A0ACD2ZZ43_9AGAR|nr:hypothetical protein BDN72DRAFT_906362 [Pluteus cervinus]
MSSAAPQATAHFLSKPPSCTPSTTRTTTYDIPGALALQAPDFFVQSHSIKAQAASPSFAGGPSPPFTTSTPPTPTLTVSDNESPRRPNAGGFCPLVVERVVVVGGRRC